MSEELYLVLWGAITGLLSALILEFAKQRLERKKVDYQETQEINRKRSEKVREFLDGEPASDPQGQVHAPAWLRQITAGRRYPLARLGLRSDEDYGTDNHKLRQETDPQHSFTTLLKIFSKGPTRAKHPCKTKGGKFLLGPSHLIGRGGKCDIQLLDPAVSLIHALIRFEGDRYRLYDLGSTGGTYVNGELVGPLGIALSGGEIICMGESTFEFGMAAKGAEPEQADTFLLA